MTTALRAMEITQLPSLQAREKSVADCLTIADQSESRCCLPDPQSCPAATFSPTLTLDPRMSIWIVYIPGTMGFLARDFCNSRTPNPEGSWGLCTANMELLCLCLLPSWVASGSRAGQAPTSGGIAVVRCLGRVLSHARSGSGEKVHTFLTRRGRKDIQSTCSVHCLRSIFSTRI
jgi:hypothetical protein